MVAAASAVSVAKAFDVPFQLRSQSPHIHA